MKILVTGGAGYIGSTLVPELLRLGHEVTVVDNFMYNQTPLLELCHLDSLRIIRGDVRDEELIAAEVKKVDAVIPLACLTGAPICAQNPSEAHAINFEAVKKMIGWLSPDQKLIYPCTNSGYGVGQEGIHCDEDSPLKPVSLYGRLKVDLESLILDHGNFVTFRFATLFGTSPRMRLDLLVNDFTYRAVVDRAVVLFEPHFKRNYLHVRDAAAAFIHTLENYDQMKGRPFNVGLSEANLSKQELCDVIQGVLPKFQYTVSDIGEDPDKRNYIVSNKRIEATGFKATHGLERGVQELVKGYQVLRRNQYANI